MDRLNLHQNSDHYWSMSNNNNNNNNIVQQQQQPFLNLNDTYQNLVPPMTNNINGGFNFLDNYSLESEFNRMSLSAPPQSPGYLTPSPLGLDMSGGYTNPRANYTSGFDFPYVHPQLSNGDIRRMRVQYAARMLGLPYDHPQNLELFCVNGGGNNNPGAGAYLDYDDSMSYGLNGFRNHDQGRRARVLNNHLSSRARNGNPYMDGVQSNNGDAYRARPRASYASLEEIRGRIYMVAKDQLGCRFIQEKFEKGTKEEINLVFSEIKEHIGELMMDQFGNYLVQRMFEKCAEDQLNQLLLLIINDERNLVTICLDMHGTRAMQHLLEQLETTEQRTLFTSALRRIVVTLTKNPNGHHVVESCLKLFTTEQNMHILNVIADNCLDIAIDKNGCCVIQQCVANAQGEPRQRLLAEITSNALVLSEHPYGNYVVQYILGLHVPHVTSDILGQLSGHFVSLSMDKYGSNVVEKCLKESEGNHVYKIIEEIIRSPKFLTVLLDPYGNYVAQSALSISKGEVRHAIVNHINANYAFLHSHPHGKRVLARTKASKLRV